MKKDLVAFKGVKEGIYININGNDFLEIKKEVELKMKNTASFYQGTKLLGIKADELTFEEIFHLKMIFKYKYDLVIEDDELPKHILEESTESSHNTSKQGEDDEGIHCGMTKFVNGTLRSGQVVEYDGNIVIIGDVNPGALIKGKGNIIVMGTLRGVAHAGMDGNTEAIVSAYNLQPTQLRIGDMIARPPDDIEGTFKVPEVARIKDGEVIIEPYLPNK